MEDIIQNSLIIYKTTNLVNGKIYIGQDSKNNPNYLGSGTLLKLSIKKYGKENFIKEILEHCNSREELNIREEYWVTNLKSMNRSIGYNLKSGGNQNILFSEESIDKIRKSRLGHKQSPETIEKRRKSLTGIKHKPHKPHDLSAEFREKLSTLMKERNKVMIFEMTAARIKQYESMRGVKRLPRTQEWSDNISKAKKGIPSIMKGIPKSEVCKDRMRKPKGPQIKLTCPYCKKEGGATNMKRYHYNNCKNIK
jgi:group I intron endonuclease